MFLPTRLIFISLLPQPRTLIAFMLAQDYMVMTPSKLIKQRHNLLAVEEVVLKLPTSLAPQCRDYPLEDFNFLVVY